MARRSLKPQLNQIRSWVQQGRTDAWIAHQLDVSVGDLVAFKREHELAPPEADGDSNGGGGPVAEEEQDLRAQDEALIAAALDAEPDEPEDKGDDAEGDGEGDGDGGERPKRRRGRRGGRARRGRKKALEGTFDHGEEGYGLWLDPAVQEDPIYAEHWAGHRPVTVTVERDQIVIRRAGEGADSGEGDGDGANGDGNAGGDGGGGSAAGPDPDSFDA